MSDGRGKQASVRATTIASGLGACAVIAACAQPAPTSVTVGDAASPSDYASPPELKAAQRDGRDMLALSGVSRPDAMIRVVLSDGRAMGATASHAGAWSVTVPGGPVVKLYSLSEDVAGQPLRARGYIAALPAPGASAAILRPGAGAEALSPVGSTLAITALDYDRSGVAVASGWARPGEEVRLLLDGAEAGEDRAAANGAFAAALSQSLNGGSHVLSAQSPSGRASAAFRAEPTAPLSRPGFIATRVQAAWRIDWMTPGGGAQTTIVFDPKGPTT